MDNEPVEQTQSDNETEEKQSQPEQDQPGVSLNSSADPRMDPLFLRVAEYFGVTDKTYRNAVNKLVEIIGWAKGETNSKNPADIILKIAETSRSLQSPGYGEHRWAILHRYVRLLNEAKPIDEGIKALEQKKADIQKEMKAYENGVT